MPLPAVQPVWANQAKGEPWAMVSRIVSGAAASRSSRLLAYRRSLTIRPAAGGGAGRSRTISMSQSPIRSVTALSLSQAGSASVFAVAGYARTSG